MDPLATVLDVAVLSLAVSLAAMTFLTANRYRERRFALVGLAMLGVGSVGALGLFDLAAPGTVPGASLGFASSLGLLFAEGAFYLSLVVGRRRAVEPLGARPSL